MYMDSENIQVGLSIFINIQNTIIVFNCRFVVVIPEGTGDRTNPQGDSSKAGRQRKCGVAGPMWKTQLIGVVQMCRRAS